MGRTYPFQAVGYNSAGIPCETAVFVWTSSATDVATIDNNGIATAIAAGQSTITARTGVRAAARSATAVLQVTAAEAVVTQALPGGINPVRGRPTGPGYAAYDRQPDGTGEPEGLFVEPLQLTMVRGESRYLDFRAVRSDGQNASRVPIIFQVDPGGERIVAVDSFGLIASLGEPGTATVRLVTPRHARIRATQVRVEVTADSVRFNVTRLSLEPGAVETLSVFIPAQQRALNPSGLFQFSSSDTTKVRINPVQPIIEATGPGTARIVAHSSMYPEISATISVHRRVESLELVPADSILTIAIGGGDTLRPRALAADGTPVPEAPVTWRIGDSSVVAFDPASGVVRGRRVGITQITAMAPQGRDSVVMRGLRVRVVAGGLAASRTRLGLGVSERAAIDVALLDDEGRPVGSAMSLLTWSSSADSVARVQGDQILGLRPGRARLAARAAWDSTVAVDVFVVGDVIVSGQRAGMRDLIVKWSAGQNSAAITSDTLVELQAAWSPDRTRVAFTAQAGPNLRNPTSALYIMNIDGSGRRRLTHDSATVRYPSFAGSENRIVFEWDQGGRAQIWMAEIRDSASATLRQITVHTPGNPNTSPSVSPDGRRIAYVSVRETSPGRPAYGIYTASIEGTDERPVLSVPQGRRLDQPSFGADGRLYFLRGEPGRTPVQRVWRMGLTGAPADSAMPITPETIFVRSFSVSPDGSLLALNALEAGQRNQQLSRVSLFTVATGATLALDSSPEEQLANPVLRPAAPAQPAQPAPNPAR